MIKRAYSPKHQSRFWNLLKSVVSGGVRTHAAMPSECSDLAEKLIRLRPTP